RRVENAPAASCGKDILACDARLIENDLAGGDGETDQPIDGNAGAFPIDQHERDLAVVRARGDDEMRRRFRVEDEPLLTGESQTVSALRETRLDALRPPRGRRIGERGHWNHIAGADL